LQGKHNTCFSKSISLSIIIFIINNDFKTFINDQNCHLLVNNNFLSALRRARTSEKLPAALVSLEGELKWFLDKGAASKL
jgi:hypothetical protein